MTATAPPSDPTWVCNWVVDTGFSPSRRSSGRCGHVAHGARLVVVHVDELRQPGDREDLPVVIGQPVGGQLPAVPPGPGQQPDQQGDAAGVHVVDLAEVEDDGLRLPGGRIGVGGLHALAGVRAQVTGDVENDDAGPRDPDPEPRTHGDVPFRCWTSSTVCPPTESRTRTSSTSSRIRNSPHPRGDWAPASFASRSGSSTSWSPAPLTARSVTVTRTAVSVAATTRRTERSGRQSLPCSIAFMVASPTAVATASRRLFGRPSGSMASARSGRAPRSPPRSLTTSK